MINIEITGTNAGQKPVFLSQPGTGEEPVPDIHTDDVVRKARAMLLMQDKPDPRAMNLIQMAENALKNGNPGSANEFAGKVLQMLSLKKLDKISGRTIRIPVPADVKKVKNVKAEKKHTEHTYQDASNDPGVSFTYPGNLTGPESFLAVPAHEHEHVRHSLREAILNGERVLTLVSYRIRYDPATGEAYMAGGVTRTIKFPDIPQPEKGKKVDVYA